MSTILRLTYQRISMGLSKAELARRAKLDQGLISKIESGRFMPYKVQLEKLERVLGIPGEELLQAIKED